MFWFWVHLGASTIALLLMLSVAALSYKKKFSYHKYIGAGVVSFGLIGLVGLLLYGCVISFENLASLATIHQLLGSVALALSIVVFILAFKTRKFHCMLGYIVAASALVSLMLAFLSYGHLVLAGLGLDSGGEECFSPHELEGDARCLFAIDSTVYDMSNMAQWSGAGHIVDGEEYHLCGGSISKQVMDEMLLGLGQQLHEEERYFRPVVGKLCE